MKDIIKKNNVLIILSFSLLCLFALPKNALSIDSISQQKLTEKLTNSFRSDGWSDLSFKTSETDTVLIHHAGLQTSSRLTEGELLSALGIILKPDVISKLKDSGFKRGIFIDGKSREYPFEISTKYYDELQAFFHRLSGGR
ncbi:MAG TPA: hypothetical protein ENK96_08805 [Desulfobulbaceae bacterium]|nr:hypothetical protein [Desulfobulbaceae bacterium]